MERQEIAVKNSLGKLPLPDDPLIYVPHKREEHEISLLDISEEAALYLTNYFLSIRIPSTESPFAGALLRDLRYSHRTRLFIDIRSGICGDDQEILVPPSG
jgi:hypothetical protein